VTGKFVGIVPSALEDVVGQQGLNFAEKSVLLNLVLLADYKTGGRTGWTIREAAERWGCTRKACGQSSSAWPRWA
jgi:hypothetical protein